MKAVFLQKNHGSLEMPKFTVLSERMGQGGGYRNGAPPHGLAQQMQQGSGYVHAFKPTRLQKLMGQ